MDWENQLEKKSDKKNWKKAVKIKENIAHAIKKACSEKASFVQTPCSYSTG